MAQVWVFAYWREAQLMDVVELMSTFDVRRGSYYTWRRFDEGKWVAGVFLSVPWLNDG